VVGFALYVLAGSGILFFDHQQNRMAPSQCHRARGSHRMTQPTTSDELELLKRHIRDVPDFPQPGVLFRDITPMLADPESFSRAGDALARPYSGIDKVVAIESRGFILGAPVALALHAGLVPVRKVGRLPADTLREDYSLEYGVNVVEIHKDAIQSGERVLIVDDVLATGGTVRAAANMVQRLGGIVVGVSLLVELSFLGGRDRLQDLDLHTVLVY
jgi:adenine phosphoribosyltransferase